MMMQMNNKNNSPFYRNPWSNPSQPKKKVVSIPVHFVGSDSAMKIELRNNNSAIKIQRVVRGFLVRNSMRRIKAIRVELENIEDKVCVPETKELIGREQKERVKVSESIMNLLLKLDSVRVLDYYSGVRDYRKSVIKKAIALQELVDQIQMAGPTHQDQPQLTRIDVEVVQSCNARGSHLMIFGEDTDADRKKMEGSRDEKNEMSQLSRVDVKVERSYSAQNSHLMKTGEDIDADRMKMEGLRDDKEEIEVEENNKEKEEEDGVEEESGFLLVRSMKDVNAKGKKMEGLRDDDEEEEEEEEKEDGDGVGEESVGTSMVEEVEENCLVKEEVYEGCKDGVGGEGDYENNKNKELLERMVEDNERMMDMMAQLFERNEMQTKLLSSLSQRVEQLERAYACDKLRRKKRRNADAKHRQIH